jgi:hypothetical protein
MPDNNTSKGINNPRIKQVLLVFSIPKTPTQAARELSLRKLKLKPFLENHLLKCLNPEARKGRFYIVSEKARKCYKILCSDSSGKNWECIGWIISSPRQRLAIMRCIDDRKLTSEEIRMRATQFNSHLSRSSTKNILRELGARHLVDSDILEGFKFYWANLYGLKIKNELAVIAPISPGFSSVSTF